MEYSSVNALPFPPVSYLLYVYVLSWWGHINRADLWLLGRSSLGSWSTLSCPYSLTGTPQTHTYHQDHCQDATPHSSHSSTDTTTLKNQDYCSAFCMLTFLVSQILLLFYIGFSVPCISVYYSLSALPSLKKCINSQKAGDKHCSNRGWSIS